MPENHPPASRSTIVAGADGCRGGWLCVSHPFAAPDKATWEIFETFGDLLAALPADATLAIDMPIGLPARTGPGGRAADRAARAVLGARQSSVFAVPARAAVYTDTYAAACAVALANSDPPRKVAKQTFNLFPKIREVDALMSPDRQARIVECHPEVAFWAMNAGTPLSEPKKVKSRPYPPGLALRRRLLEAAGFEAAFLASLDLPARCAGPDDLLDAAATAWTAARVATGMASRFPTAEEAAEKDPRGLRMEIVY